MRCTKLVSLALALLFAAIIGASTEAEAFGDQCLNPVRVKGDVRSSQGGAMAAAREAWEASVARRNGPRFANWYYSGDRDMDCSWDRSGTRFRCITTATPCGRKR